MTELFKISSMVCDELRDVGYVCNYTTKIRLFDNNR